MGHPWHLICTKIFSAWRLVLKVSPWSIQNHSAAPVLQHLRQPSKHFRKHTKNLHHQRGKQVNLQGIAAILPGLPSLETKSLQFDPSSWLIETGLAPGLNITPVHPFNPRQLRAISPTISPREKMWKYLKSVLFGKALLQGSDLRQLTDWAVEFPPTKNPPLPVASTLEWSGRQATSRTLQLLVMGQWWHIMPCHDHV